MDKDKGIKGVFKGLRFKNVTQWKKYEDEFGFSDPKLPYNIYNDLQLGHNCFIISVY